MTKFLLVRHATTSAVGRHLSGRMPGVSLNEEGQIQAKDVAQRLANLPIAGVYTSPLERALQTARTIAESHHLTPVIEEDLMEIDFGGWTNRSFDELQPDPQFQLFNTFRSHSRIPGGESMLEAQGRIVRGLQKLWDRHPSDTLVLVSHSDMIKAALAYYAGIPLDLFQRLEISPASVSILELYPETARILLINHTGTLKL